MERFSDAGANARIVGILDAGSFAPLPESKSSTLVGAGRVGGEPVWIAATDPARARGALGVAEADALCQLFREARGKPQPLFLLLDSAGAKVDEGLAGLGAFRRLFHEALLTRVVGVPMLALLGRSCFGGASMLASLCNARVYSSATLLAVSGPAVIEALGGKAELDASDRNQVRALMGGEARTQLGAEEWICADSLDTLRALATQWLSSERSLPTEADTIGRHEKLRMRLEGDPLANAPVTEQPYHTALEHLIPGGYTSTMRETVSLSVPAIGSSDCAFLGILTGRPVGARACWILADELLRLRRTNPASPVVLVLDSPGHATTRRDEAILLSAYLAHLSTVAAALVAGGQSVTLWISGAAAGAVYVAFAAPAQRVCALATARIRILPEAAVREIVGSGLDEPTGPDALILAGVIDALLELEPETKNEGTKAG